jgi:tripartite ATP-independent transporter DctP family solute receptor
MHRTLRVLTALLLALAAALPAAAQVPAKKLVRIHTAGPTDLGVDTTMLAHQFMSYVNANSDSVEVKVFPNSQLGQTREVIEAMRLGSGASGTTGGPAEYASFVKRLGVLGLPFLWNSYDHANAVLDGSVGKELDAEMEKAGFKVLSWAVSWGYRNVVTAKKEVTKASDLKGLKIRTIPTKVFVSAINAMGANATPMNFGEIYTSLQSGVLDGYEHTAATTISFKMYEVACCMALTKHLMDPTFLVFSLAEWKKLSPTEQAALQKAATEAGKVVREMAPQREGEALAQVRKLGMKVNEIDTAPLVKAALQAQDELAKEFGAEKLLDQIRKTPG